MNHILNYKIKLFPIELCSDKKLLNKCLKKKISNEIEGKCINIGYIKKIIKILKINQGIINDTELDGSIVFDVILKVIYYPIPKNGDIINVNINSNINNNMIMANNNIYDCIIELTNYDIENTDLSIGTNIDVTVKHAKSFLYHSMFKVICSL